MPTATQTLYAEQKAKQNASDAELHACAVREFPIGCPVQWVHVHGKPPVKAIVVAHGMVYRGLVSLSWELETKSGARHTVGVHRLEPQEPSVVRVKKAASVGKSEAPLNVIAPESEPPKRPKSFDPPSQEIWP